MRKEFNELEKELNSYIVYCNEIILQKLENLNKKIVEVEKRLVCVDRIATHTVETIGKFTDYVDSGYMFKMGVNDHDAIQRGAFDIQIAVDLNDTEPIESNWYELFQTETDVILKGRNAGIWSMLILPDDVNCTSADGTAFVEYGWFRYGPKLFEI